MSKARSNFIRLAEARTNKALRAIDLIGNLANQSNYSYEQEEVQKIMEALKDRVKNVERRFEIQSVKDNDYNFKL